MSVLKCGLFSLSVLFSITMFSTENIHANIFSISSELRQNNYNSSKKFKTVDKLKSFLAHTLYFTLTSSHPEWLNRDPKAFEAIQNTLTLVDQSYFNLQKDIWAKPLPTSLMKSVMNELEIIGKKIQIDEKKRIHGKFESIEFIEHDELDEFQRQNALSFTKAIQDIQSESSLNIQLEHALKASQSFENTVLQSYKVLWTRKALLKHIDKDIRSHSHANMLLTALTSGAIARQLLKSSRVREWLAAATASILAATASPYFALPFYKGIQQILEKESVQITLATITGIGVSQLYYPYARSRWMIQNPLPDYPAIKAMEPYFTWIEIILGTKFKSDNFIERSTELLQMIEAVKPGLLCEALLKSSDAGNSQ